MGVTIREPQKGAGMPRMASLLVRRSILPASVVGATDGGNTAADDDAYFGDSAAGDWQPADSILEDPEASNPSACSASGARCLWLVALGSTALKGLRVTQFAGAPVRICCVSCSSPLCMLQQARRPAASPGARWAAALSAWKSGASCAR